jgi:hypothetical protein
MYCTIHSNLQPLSAVFQVNLNPRAWIGRAGNGFSKSKQPQVPNNAINSADASCRNDGGGQPNLAATQTRQSRSTYKVVVSYCFVVPDAFFASWGLGDDNPPRLLGPFCCCQPARLVFQLASASNRGREGLVCRTANAVSSKSVDVADHAIDAWENRVLMIMGPSSPRPALSMVEYHCRAVDQLLRISVRTASPAAQTSRPQPRPSLEAFSS